jgi:hypothetical protein
MIHFMVQTHTRALVVRHDKWLDSETAETSGTLNGSKGSGI